MKKVAVAVFMVLALVSASWAIDGAAGIGQGKTKLEAGYTGGAIGLQFDYGLTQDWTVYGSVQTMSGFTGFGVGTKYAILNEKRGDGFSLAPKIDLLLGSGGMSPMFGLVGSKKLDSKLTVLGDISIWSPGFFSYTWLGAGALYNIDEKLQVSGMLGIATVTVDFLGYKYSASGIGFGLGLNYLF